MGTTTTSATRPSRASLTGKKGVLTNVTLATSYANVTTSPCLLGSVITTYVATATSITIKDLATTTEYVISTLGTAVGVLTSNVTFGVPPYFSAGFAIKAGDITGAPKAVVNYTTI